MSDILSISGLLYIYILYYIHTIHAHGDMPYMLMSYTHLFSVHIPLPTFLFPLLWCTHLFCTHVSNEHVVEGTIVSKVFLPDRFSTSSRRIIRCDSRPEGGQVVAYPGVSGWTFLGWERQPCRFGDS